MKTVLVLGYFGYHTNQLDGQTVKTRNVLQLFTQNIGRESIDIFDTEDFRYNKKTLFFMVCKIVRCKTLVYLPAHNNLKWFIVPIYIISLFKRFDILYLVIGGWLSEFLKNKPVHRYLLGKIKLICPETEALTNYLRNEYHYQNVLQLPNFRFHTYEIEKTKKTLGFKLVFMARIHKMKGLETIFSIMECLKNKNITIDFYGPIFQGHKAYFEEQLRSHSNNTRYCGVLEPERIYNTLSQYDLMLFPTLYYTEGFPGSILDAYISGIPVIVSDWQYATEFVKEGISGFICPVQNVKVFCDKIVNLYEDRDLLSKLKQGAHFEAQKYSAEAVWKQLKLYL